MNSKTMSQMRWVSLVLIGLAVALMSIGPKEAEQSATAMLADGTDSATVAELKAQAEAQTGEDAGQAAIVFFSGVSPETLPELGRIAEDLGGPLIPNEDATSAIVPVQIESESLTGNLDKVEELRADVSDAAPDGVTAQVTGPAAIEADLSGVFSGANFKLLAVTGIIVAILLIATYRSPILWIIPLLVIGIADRLVATVFTWVLEPLGMHWNESTAGILSVLVFGAGTNYALLLISRYRDELHLTENRFEAMARAWKPTVTTILASVATVVIGVLCLLASLTPTTRALGAAAAIGVTIAFLFGAFVLPGVLVIFGRWVFWPKRPQVGEKTEHKVFDAVGRTVEKHPKAITVGALAALGVMCLGALQISTGLTQSDQFIEKPESITAAQELSEAFPNMSATPATVTAEPGAREALEVGGYSVTEADGFLTVSGGTTEELRQVLEGTGALVGGPDAELYDTEQAAERDRAIIFPLVLILVFVALIALLRSLVAPLIMVASVLLTNVAALGVGWWVSHYLLGFERFDSTTPLYAFVFLVALGIDYTIFLVTRTREAATTEGTRQAILTSLSTTGSVITSAGILLAAVFAALGVLPLVVLAQIGVIICLGVLLDTLIVRTLVVPSVVQLLGEKFWWPAKVDPVSHDQRSAA